MAFARTIVTTHTKTLLAPSTGVADKVYGADYVSASSHSSAGTLSGATSGGIFYASSATTEDCSALLASGGVVLGGGVGGAPNTNANLTYSDTGGNSGPSLLVGTTGTSTGIRIGYGGFSGNGAVHCGAIASPSTSNYALLLSTGQTVINSPSSALQFNIGGSNVMTISSTGGVPTFCQATATPANGSTSARLLLGTTAGFGIYYGSGAPTVTAAQGSIYINSTGSGIADRLYVNTTGSTTWTNFVSAA